MLRGKRTRGWGGEWEQDSQVHGAREHRGLERLHGPGSPCLLLEPCCPATAGCGPT